MRPKAIVGKRIESAHDDEKIGEECERLKQVIWLYEGESDCEESLRETTHHSELDDLIQVLLGLADGEGKVDEKHDIKNAVDVDESVGQDIFVFAKHPLDE